MQAVRLLGEGVELMGSGRITLPRPERDLLIEIRAGAWRLPDLLDKAARLAKELEAAAATSALPERVGRDAVSRLVADAYLASWASAADPRAKLADGAKR